MFRYNDYTKNNEMFHRKCRTRGEIVTEFAAVAQQVWSGNVKSIAPRDLRYTIGQYEKMFSGYEQQDAHEFLTILMDLLHSELQITRKEVNKLIFTTSYPSKSDPLKQ